MVGDVPRAWGVRLDEGLFYRILEPDCGTASRTLFRRSLVHWIIANGNLTWSRAMEMPTQEQLNELKRLSSDAGVADESKLADTKEDAETLIEALKEKAQLS